MPCVGVWHSTETLLFPGPCGWCLLSSHLQWGCASLVELGWSGGAAMESLPCASGCATKLPLARVRSCSAGMVLKIGPRCIFPLSCTFPFPSLPRARAQHSHGGTLVYRSAWWGAEDPWLCRSSRCPCSLPAASVFPSTLRESAWGPFATPGSWYLLLLSFFKKKK